MDPSALSHSLGIGAEVFPLLDRPFPVSGVPLMARPPPCGVGVRSGGIQIILSTGCSAPYAASLA